MKTPIQLKTPLQDTDTRDVKRPIDHLDDLCKDMAALSLAPSRRKRTCKRTYDESVTMLPSPIMVVEEEEDSPRSRSKRFRSTSMYQWRTQDELCKCMGALTLQ